MKPVTGKTKNDIYARTFEILDLRKELIQMKDDYKVKKARYDRLVKEEKAYRDREESRLK